jgi:hypothetical protein
MGRAESNRKYWKTQRIVERVLIQDGIIKKRNYNELQQ